MEGDLSDLSKGNEILFSLSAENDEEVDEWIKAVEMAGGRILFNPRKDSKEQYDKHGFVVVVFSDPDGHKFNILYNPNK